MDQARNEPVHQAKLLNSEINAATLNRLPDMEPDVDEEMLIQHILDKHTQWQAEQSTIAAASVTLPSNNPEEAVDISSLLPVDERLKEALDVMHRLDEILVIKTLYLERQILESSDTPLEVPLPPLDEANELDVEELDDPNADTQSIFSTQTKHSFIDRTFITEPKPGQKSQPLARAENFITRNIDLGGDARYFDVLTPTEHARVNVMLAEEGDGEEADAGYGIASNDTLRWVKVNTLLFDLVGYKEDPGNFYEPINDRDAALVMGDVVALETPAKFLKPDLARLKEIDAHILALMGQELEEASVLSREQLDKLLRECGEPVALGI